MIDTGEMDEPQPAIPPSPATGQPPDAAQRLVDVIQRFRARAMVRTSSAMVRWILLVLAVGFAGALLVALAVQVLVSLLPGGGG
jgi:hypothetical protein